MSPYFDWFASSEALEERRALDEAKGEYSSDRFYRAFNRPDLAPGTYTKANVGLIGPREAPMHGSALLAVCADAKGWAALLWGHARNRWKWEDLEPFLFSDDPSHREYMHRYDAARECGEHIEITCAAVGVSSFTALAQFDGLALNAGAGVCSGSTRRKRSGSERAPGRAGRTGTSTFAVGTWPRCAARLHAARTPWTRGTRAASRA